jgi:hypothetical protein
MPGKAEEKMAVRRRIGGGAEIALHHVTLQIDDHHLLRGQVGIINTAWLDGKDSGLPVDHADIPKRKIDKAGRRKKAVGLTTLFADSLMG